MSSQKCIWFKSLRQLLSTAHPQDPRRLRSAEDRQELPHNETLFEALRTWRREKAVELGNLPAYVVYTDRTLRELAAGMPQTQVDLLEVPGIGPAKARQYGAETLAVVRRLSGENR